MISSTMTRIRTALTAIGSFTRMIRNGEIANAGKAMDDHNGNQKLLRPTTSSVIVAASASPSATKIPMNERYGARAADNPLVAASEVGVWVAIGSNLFIHLAT